ncbi:MAG: hypothetical protein B6U85_07480 [Desulfurococcales archaeon ex4484_42]|nr:MAG: hypothetical protein B6U85_07480 [Desulfurococcales archaeon ex4484_42]
MTIELRNVWFTYPGLKRWVLRNVNYLFNDNKTYAILGPNGAGKTTLMKLIALLYRPNKGSIITWGYEYWKLPKDRRLSIRRRIVYVHEKSILLKGDVLYNIAFGLIIRGVKRDEALSEALRILKDLNLDYLATRDTSALSMGEAQLISIIRAIIIKPKFLLLDEPLAHIDIDKREAILNMLRMLKRDYGITLIISTHDVSVAKVLADEILVIREGTINKMRQLS